MALDIAISYAATYRQTERHNGNKPRTIVGKICDKIYTDDYLSKVYSNAVYILK